jgi:hypothetical protein
MFSDSGDEQEVSPLWLEVDRVIAQRYIEELCFVFFLWMDKLTILSQQKHEQGYRISGEVEGSKL